MQVGVQLRNFEPGTEDGAEAFTESFDVVGDSWREVQRRVYAQVMAGISVSVPMTPKMNGASGIITLVAGDRLLDEEVAQIRQTVNAALQPYRLAS